MKVLAATEEANPARTAAAVAVLTIVIILEEKSEDEECLKSWRADGEKLRHPSAYLYTPTSPAYPTTARSHISSINNPKKKLGSTNDPFPKIIDRPFASQNSQKSLGCHDLSHALDWPTHFLLALSSSRFDGTIASNAVATGPKSINAQRSVGKSDGCILGSDRSRDIDSVKSISGNGGRDEVGRTIMEETRREEACPESENEVKDRSRYVTDGKTRLVKHNKHNQHQQKKRFGSDRKKEKFN